MNTSSKSGEIALTLTIISLGMMLIGTMFGRVGLQKKPISNKSQAAGSCFYHAVAYVDKVVDGKRSKLTKSDYLNQSLTITNNLGYPSNMFDTPANPQSGQVEAVYEYPKNGIGAGSFKFGKHPTGYEDGDPAHVTLNLNNKWRVTQSECIPLLNSVDGSPDKGCNGNTIKLTDSNTISNFLVTCGVSMKYGWVVEPANTLGEPTPSPKPTAVPTTQVGIPAQCPYVATAQVLLANQTPLSLSENGGSSNFGISNDKQSQTIAAGKFGDSYQYGIKTSNAVKYAQYQYASDYEQFKPENPNALYTHEAKPNGANVALLGLGSGWKVTSTFCKPGLGALYGDKGCPASKDQGRDATIFKGFKPDCDVNINYGWYVELAPTPTRAPTVALSRPTIINNPRFPIQPSKVPTALPTKTPTPVPSATTTPSPSPTNSSSPTCEQNAQGHCDIPVTEDAYTASIRVFRDTNYGSDSFLAVGWNGEQSIGTASENIYRSYLKFDLSRLKGAKIKKAVLHFDLVACPTNRNLNIYVLGNYDGEWHENSITWNNMPIPDANVHIGTKIYATCNNSGAQEKYESTLDSRAVQKWVDVPETNFGIVLRNSSYQSGSSAIYNFASKDFKEFHDAGYNQRAPYLSIDFEGTPINPIPNKKPATPKAPAKSTLAHRDLNGDEVVNVVDFLLTIKKLGTKGVNMPEDFNNDGVVNTVDVASVIANFGKSEK